MEQGLFDMHSHILPGLDDGSRSMEMTRKMLHMAYQQGIRNMFATPHFIPGEIMNEANKVREVFEQVKEEAHDIDKDFNIFLGNELYYREGALEALQQKKLFTMADTAYVLVEFTPSIPYSQLYAGMRRFVESGYRPILAHVERYVCFYRDRERIEELTEIGVTIQMNCDSLMGGFFDTKAAYCKRLVQEGYVHLLGSDTHDDIYRPPVMSDCILLLEKKKLNRVLLEKIIYNNPDRLIKNLFI